MRGSAPVPYSPSSPSIIVVLRGENLECRFACLDVCVHMRVRRGREDEMWAMRMGADCMSGQWMPAAHFSSPSPPGSPQLGSLCFCVASIWDVLPGLHRAIDGFGFRLAVFFYIFLP
jgi:hypothetical protein